jgi:hypothetical protein
MSYVMAKVIHLYAMPENEVKDKKCLEVLNKTPCG